MTRGEEIALSAMKKEHSRLSKIADKAKKECDEACSIGSEMIAIHEEFVKIVKSGETGKEVVDKLSSLQKRKERAEKIMKKDIVKLSDKQCQAEIEREALYAEICSKEWGIKMRNRA